MSEVRSVVRWEVKERVVWANRVRSPQLEINGTTLTYFSGCAIHSCLFADIVILILCWCVCGPLKLVPRLTQSVPVTLIIIVVPRHKLFIWKILSYLTIIPLLCIIDDLTVSRRFKSLLIISIWCFRSSRTIKMQQLYFFPPFLLKNSRHRTIINSKL